MNTIISKNLKGGGKLSKLRALLSAVATSAAISMALCVSMVPSPSYADSVTNVTINSVVQRWPWNNKVDISYTVEGGQARALGIYCGLRFAFTANGQTYNFEGYSIGASAENGSHTVTWTAPQGIVTADGSLTATLFTTNVPSGNDYMIIDLMTGAVWYEGLLTTQDASNSRYNVAEYKESKMVLRKVPKWADKDTLPNAADLAAMNGYPTGDNVNYASDNSVKKWPTDRDYYTGVFLVTQRQYADVCGSNPSANTAVIEGNVVAHRPVEQVSWNDLRCSGTAPTSSIPAVASNSGTFFQRLNYKTGLYFDLPTEVMAEIAERAGATTVYSWGDSNANVTDYAVCKENSEYPAGSTTYYPKAVGSLLPNAWGLYDTAGNVWEVCRDDDTLLNLADAADPFKPACANGTRRRWRGGGPYDNSGTGNGSRASLRFRNLPGNRNPAQGFRVSMIVE